MVANISWGGVGYIKRFSEVKNEKSIISSNLFERFCTAIIIFTLKLYWFKMLKWFKSRTLGAARKEILIAHLGLPLFLPDSRWDG